MKIAVTGSTGLIGTGLIQQLKAKGHEIIALRREHFDMPDDALKTVLAGSQAIIHLAGAPITKRWTSSYKKELYESRIDTTRKLVDTIRLMEKKPDVFISTSAIGIYKPGLEHSENSYGFDEGFLGKLCQDWEQGALAVKSLTRVVIFRMGVVLDKNGGALAKLLPVFRAGIGGPVASGKQGFSWVHLKDVLKAYEFVLEHNNLHGVFNMTAPGPVTNKEFTNTLAKVLNRPAVVPVPEPALRALYGQAATTLTTGAFVKPINLIQAGFQFDFPELEAALQDILT